MRLFTFLIVTLFAAPLLAESEEITFEFGGLEREVLLTVPDTLDGPAPLVLAIHGLLENGAAMRNRVTLRRLDALAERYGFVVAYPSAIGLVWSPGTPLPTRAPGPARDDPAYLKAVIDLVRDRVAIDERRIFATGFSQGGLMSFALACRNPGLIRAVASVAMPLPEALTADCARHPPDGVMFVHGTEDPIVPFDGGPIPAGPRASTELKSFDASVEFFRRTKGCAGSGEIRTWDARDDGTEVLRRAWYGCRRGAVEGYRVEGMGHRWPSGGPLFPVAAITGETTREIDGAATVLGFFSRFK